MTETPQIPDRARLVVIGAGIAGCSAVYHLAQLGWRDIVVLDQGPLFETGGSTSHAPGGVFQTNFSRMMTEFARCTVRLYNALELDGEPCFHSVGGLEVAATPERWHDLKRKAGAAKSWGVEAELISPAEARGLVPILDETKIHGAYHVPGDGIARAVRAAGAMARSSAGAAVFIGRTEVTGIEVAGGRVRAVLTSRGRIAAGTVLVCAGIWGPRIGRMAGVEIPLAPVQHQYALSAPLPELAGETREVAHPVMRHQDRAMYFRQHADCYGIGSYQHEPLPVRPGELSGFDGNAPPPAIREFTPEHFEAAHADAVELLPALRGAPLTRGINGIFSFTPDGMPLIGPSPEVGGFWVAEAIWITHAGGAGKAVAEWMTTGAPEVDLREADLNRFPGHALTPEYVEARGAQQYREVYDIIHPLQQMENPRDLRLSPFHPRQRELGAVFFESAGWEVPQWFEANARLPRDPSWPERSGWEARGWSPIQGAEHRAARQNAVLYDLTPLAKIEVHGRKAASFLQFIAANQVDRPAGTVIYTPMLNAAGGIRGDVVVARLEKERFLVFTGAGAGPADLAWFGLHAPGDGSVQIAETTSRFCGLGLWGPGAQEILQPLCRDRLDEMAFPRFTARPIDVGAVPALAMRLSYAGEPGWEIYTETDYGSKLWDLLWESGQAAGIAPLGAGAFDSLRLEKGYRLRGSDIHAEYDPFEAGLGWTVKLDKGNFLGRDALLARRQRGLERRLSCMTLDDPEAVVLGKEPILDGERVLGSVTSSNRGYSVGKHIAYGYLPVRNAAPGNRVEIEYFGERLAATVAAEPLLPSIRGAAS